VTGSEERLEEAMEEALAKIDGLRVAYDALPPPLNGAAQAADMILALAVERMR